MSDTIVYTGTLVTTRCWCGINHAVPQSLIDQSKRDGKTSVYCPLGHSGIYGGDTEDRRTTVAR